MNIRLCRTVTVRNYRQKWTNRPLMHRLVRKESNAEYSVRLATALGWDKEKIDTLRYEGLLHDIGKIGISDVILNKAAALSDDEYDMLKDHVTIGYDIMHDASTLPGAANVIRYHHERFDGTGYPNGLKGEQIPLDARIVSIVDTYDAMSSNRIYRKALPKEKIREERLKTIMLFTGMRSAVKDRNAVSARLTIRVNRIRPEKSIRNAPVKKGM